MSNKKREAQGADGVSGHERALARVQALQEAFNERIAELELSLEETGYTMLGGFQENEFTRDALRRIARESRIFFLKNPLVRRAVLTQASYCFAQGVTVKARHPLIDEAVQRFMVDKRNKMEFTTPQALMQREADLALDGNLFLALFQNSKGDVRVRALLFDEITDIVADPDDPKSVHYYERAGVDEQGRPIVQYYPDLSYRPAVQPARFQRTEHHEEGDILWDTPVLQVRVNALNGQRFGLSEVYSAQEWARMYNQFLNDFAMVMRAHARFAWRETVKGGAGQRAKAKAALDSGIAGGQRSKPAPVAGSVLVETEGKSRMEPIVTAGAAGGVEDGRRLLLMVSAATGVFEHYFGDPATGNLATATTMDRPMELSFMARQRLWQDTIEQVCEYVVLVAARHSRIKDVTVKEAPSAWEDEMEATYSKDPLLRAGDEDVSLDPEEADKPIDTSVEVSFPDLVERDMLQHMQAIQTGATVGGTGADGDTWKEYITRQVLQAFGEQSVEELMALLYPEDAEVEDEEEEPEAPDGAAPVPPVPAGRPVLDPVTGQPIAPAFQPVQVEDVQTEAVRQALLSLKERARALLEARLLLDAETGCGHDHSSEG